MTDKINFKAYWNEQKIETSEAKQVIKKASEFKRKTRNRLIASNLILLTTCMFIGFIWFYYQPQFLSTKLGIIICIMAMLSYLAVLNSMTPLLSNQGIELDAKTQLTQLISLKEKQRFQHTTLLNIYFILLSLGLSLYMHEYTSRMSLQWAMISYSIVLFWIALNAFYFRPKAIVKQQRRLNELIAQLKNVNKQLTT